MLETTIGSLNTVPFKMLRMVPFGDSHICGSHSATSASQHLHTRLATAGASHVFDWPPAGGQDHASQDYQTAHMAQNDAMAESGTAGVTVLIGIMFECVVLATQAQHFSYQHAYASSNDTTPWKTF